ncbi:SANT/Myb-like DNA-binding domain-containing protein, partial [Bacteroides xylanisolvens]
MDYIEAVKNLKTNNKWGRKSPHKAILLLAVIELYEKNILMDNEIRYDETLKSTFLEMWNMTLPNESLFHPDVYLPFWYLQSDNFWHIVPYRGKEDILTLMRDTNIKPSEAKIVDSVKYVELDEDLYFLMTLPSGRSTLKRALLETYTTLSNKQIERLAESKDNAIDYSVTALSDYEKILSQDIEENKIESTIVDDELVGQFQCLNEDVQLTLNIVYFTFLKKHRNEREMFKEICPTVYNLLDKIVNNPVKQGEITPSFAFIYENFLADLKVSLLSDNDSVELIDKIGEAIEILRGNNSKEHKESQSIHFVDTDGDDAPAEIVDFSYEDLNIKQTYLEELEKNIKAATEITLEQNRSSESRRGKSWTEDEENLIRLYYEQGKDFLTIASLIGRTEVAIKSRLAKLGLIDYTYGENNTVQTSTIFKARKLTDENDFLIDNSSNRASILDKNGQLVFVTDGKMKFLRNKLYRLNLKRECFTLKSMLFNGSVWIKGTKKIVAYPQSELYQRIITAGEYIDEVEDIVDSPDFEDCKLKFKGIWYNYNGNSITSPSNKNIVTGNRVKLSEETSDVRKTPLYAVRRQAVLHAMGHFRSPANIRDIARAISRTAWRSVIKENEVEEIVKTIPEIEYLNGKYILLKKP